MLNCHFLWCFILSLFPLYMGKIPSSELATVNGFIQNTNSQVNMIFV